MFTATHAPHKNFSLHAVGYKTRLLTSLWALSKATRAPQTPQCSVLPVPVGSQSWDGGNPGYSSFPEHPYKSHGGSGSPSSMSTWSGGLHHAIFGKMFFPTTRLVTQWDREPTGAAPQAARAPWMDMSISTWDTEGREAEELPWGHGVGDNAHVSYAQPAQWALPARSAVPRGYRVSPNLTG